MLIGDMERDWWCLTPFTPNIASIPDNLIDIFGRVTLQQFYSESTNFFRSTINFLMYKLLIVETKIYSHSRRFLFYSLSCFCDIS